MLTRFKMNKLINPTQEPQILKICYGNDFSLSVSVNVWNADTSAWDKLDLSAASDVELFLVAQNGKRIKTNTTLDESGDLTTQVPSTFLSKTIYSIEITFKLDGRNRRTYSPCLLQIVNSTEEAGRSVEEYVTNDAYHFDIMVKNDIAWLNIGALPSEYITDDELAYVLTSYATNASVENQINLLWQDCNSTFVDDDELSNAGYVTGASLSEMGYITAYDIPEYDLSSYATSLKGSGWNLNIHSPQYSFSYELSLRNSTDNELSKVLVPAHNGTKNSQDEWTTPFWSGLVLRGDYIQFKTDTDRINAIEASYVTTSYLSSTLSGYVNDAEYDSTNHNILLKNDSTTIATIDASPFIIDGMVENVVISNGYLVISFNTDAGKQDISIPISQIFDASNYYTKSDIDTTLSSYVTQSYLTSQSYATEAYVTDAIAAIVIPDPDLSSYVTYDYLTSQSYATEAYVTDAIANIPTGGGNVTYEYLSEQSYVQATYWDSSNEAIAYELANNRLDHLTINNTFNNYYTKTETDGRYATQSWANNKFVIKNDNENQNQAIAAAFASSVQSTYIHNIWAGSQSDYNQLTPDSYTLYVIL